MDVTVLDLSTVGPASRATAILADLGARVVKVLAPRAAKRIEPEAWAYGAGRGTRSIRIDLRSPDGRDAFLRLAGRANVIVESYRPGVARRLGIGYDDVRARNERIVYCAVTGYGQDGPYAQRAGHDLNYLAMGGFLATQGRRADGGPAMPGATVADSAGGGMQAAIAILGALLRGGGEFLDISTTEGVLSLTSLYHDEYAAEGVEAKPGSGLLTGKYACYDVYRASDGGWLAVGAIEPQFFANLCTRLGCDEWIPHQMDADKQDAIRDALAKAFATRTRDEWAEDLQDADTCVTPVLSIAEVARDPQHRRRRAFVASTAGFDQVAPLYGAPRPEAKVEPGKPATDEILAEAGFDDGEIAKLREQGAVE